ncbi:MAG: DUF72 domain-containing protein [Chitinophagales bacterium]|nr:DUF72 domain-containing protein [Chitinophagales bacterium]
MAKQKDEAYLLRKAKREERREKQRQQNVVRAQQMHEQRVAIKPPMMEPPSFKQQYFIGCSGWYYWHWKSIFYADTLPRDKWFDHYASRFRTVELNAPFYSWPTLATIKTWIKQAGRRHFTYTVKVNELITHTRRFEGTEELVKDFGLIADILGKRMGCFLFQLPPSFHYTAARLQNIVKQLEPNRRNVVEFRHASWWNEEVYDVFRQMGVIFCSCSGPRLPDELIKTADDIYIRFHGTKQWYRHDYSREELQVWAQRIKNSDAKHVWVYFNNDRNGYAIKNAKMLLKLLKD